MTPEQFQTLALAWLATMGTVAGVAIPLYFKIKADIEANKARIDKHDELTKVDTSHPDTPEAIGECDYGSNPPLTVSQQPLNTGFQIPQQPKDAPASLSVVAKQEAAK